VSTEPDAQRLERAARLVDGDELPAAPDLSADATRALAWSVKELCYASWSSEPQRAVRAAGALQRLRRHAAAAQAFEALPELDALVEWTGGIACLIRGDMAEATARLDAAADRFTGLGQPRHAAHTQVPKIMALAMLGRNDDAAACATSARDQLLRLGDVAAASKVSLNLGNLWLRNDRYAAAAEPLRAAAALFARIDDREHLIMAELGLADALAAMGGFDESARTYARAETLATEHGFPVLLALAEESIGLLGLARGHYRDALARLESACRSYERLQMPQHLAIAEKQLADAYLELRLLPESLAGLDAALERLRRLGMQVDQAWTQVQRGRALAMSGRAGAAEAALFDAARLFAAQDNTVGTAAVALARAELALVEGNGGLASTLARDAVAGFQRAGLVERRLRAEVVAAQAALCCGDFEGAHSAFDTTLRAARAHQVLPAQLRCLTGRALAAQAAGDRRSARRDLEAAVELFEDQRGNLPGDEMRSAFQSDHLLPFRELLRMALHSHDAGEVDAAEVLAQLDRLRARTLVDRLGGLPGSVAKQQDGTRDLRARLAWLYRRMQRMQDAAGASTALAEELHATESDLLERARRIRVAEAGRMATSASPGAGFDLGLLQQALGPDDALVEYGVLDDELFACVLTREGVALQRGLAPWHQVLDAVRAVRFQLETLRHGSAPLQKHMAVLASRTRAHLQRLHRLVWQPQAALLARRRRVLVVPHAQLGAVPFAALHDGQRYLAEIHLLAWAPSARVAWRGLARPPAVPRKLLALGESTRLPHAAQEVRRVAEMLPGGQVFVGADATRQNLDTHCGGADVIHLACHAQFRGDSPLFSALHLVDEVLFAETIESMRLPDAIVVLSACETALHEQGSGEEMFGLTRAFFVAGAARVLASLWPIDDAATAGLMTDLYAALQRGLSPAAALRHAQLAACGRHEHPFHWASFALSGGW
jgi:tetratricopeptide (TPR) repeat protein